eukprot:7671966-Ditylum_brightwellii.AAC.1
MVGKEFIMLLWYCFYHVWASWNGALHSSSHDPDSASHLNKQIHTAYSTLQHQMDTFNQQQFSKSLQDLLNTTPQSK